MNEEREEEKNHSQMHTDTQDYLRKSTPWCEIQNQLEVCVCAGLYKNSHSYYGNVHEFVDFTNGFIISRWKDTRKHTRTTIWTTLTLTQAHKYIQTQLQTKSQKYTIESEPFQYTNTIFLLFLWVCCAYPFARRVAACILLFFLFLYLSYLVCPSPLPLFCYLFCMSFNRFCIVLPLLFFRALFVCVCLSFAFISHIPMQIRFHAKSKILYWINLFLASFVVNFDCCCCCCCPNVKCTLFLKQINSQKICNKINGCPMVHDARWATLWVRILSYMIYL